MVRNYTDEPVDLQALDRIIEAGVRAPSAGFSQGQRFVVITDSETRARVAQAAGEHEYLEKGFDAWISRAPVHIIICADKKAYLDRYSEQDKSGTDDWTVPYWWIDAGASFMAILYAAVDEGLAAGFLGAHTTEGLRSMLGIPQDILVAGIVTLGHGAPDLRSGSLARGRTARDEVIHWDSW
ncbi:MAG: nitroreductase family protein [Actinomycetia bacterium]|nr:nitroreductase family protein [Actinomycetes bacterium]